MKKEKILFFGLGSIGLRHIRLIQKNFNYEIYAFRTIKNNTIEGVQNVFNEKDAFEIKPDIVFITNPTSLHLDTSLKCLNNGIKKIFIEKPVSHSVENLDLFYTKCKKECATVYIGYVLRHNP